MNEELATEKRVVSPISFGSILAKDCTTRTLVRSRSKENSFDLPSERVVVHPETSSTVDKMTTRNPDANGGGDGNYFDVLLPAQGEPEVKANSPAMVAETTSQIPVPNAVGNGNGPYFDVLVPKQASKAEEVHMQICVSEQATISGYVSSDNLEMLSSDGDSRTSSVVISERALSVSSTSSFSSSHASPVYENVTHSNAREKSHSLSPNHSRPPSSADVREDWVLPRHKNKMLDQQGSSFEEYVVIQSEGVGEHSSLVHHTHVAGQRATKSMEESSLQWEKSASRPKTSNRYVNLEAVNDAISRVTSRKGKGAVGESGHDALHEAAATEYVNVTVKEKPPKRPVSSVGGHREEEYVNIELTSKYAKRGSQQSLPMGSEYVNVDGPVLRSVKQLHGGAKADHLVLMNFGDVDGRSKEQTEKKSKFRHTRSHSCDNLMDIAEDVVEMRTTRSRSNALTENCSPSFRRWKIFGSRDSLVESPAEETPPTVTISGTKGLNYVTVAHTLNPKRTSTPSEKGLVPGKRSTSCKITGSRAAAETDVNYVQIDAIATRAVDQTLAQRNIEIANKLKKSSNKATTLC